MKALKGLAQGSLNMTQTLHVSAGVMLIVITLCDMTMTLCHDNHSCHEKVKHSVLDLHLLPMDIFLYGFVVLLILVATECHTDVIYRAACVCVCVCVCVCAPVQLCLTLGDPVDCSPTKLLCPWDSPGKNPGVGCHFLLQGISLTQGWNLCLLYLLHCQADSLPPHHLGSPVRQRTPFICVLPGATWLRSKRGPESWKALCLPTQRRWHLSLHTNMSSAHQVLHL